MNYLNIDFNFFEDKKNNYDKTIYPEDFDDQFNVISNYLKYELKPVVDSIVANVIKGEYGKENSFLMNVGDGTTSWEYLKGDYISDYTLTLNKFIKNTTGSILTSDNAGNIIFNKTDTPNKVLISNYPDSLIWDKISSKNIANNSIIGSNLGILGIENFMNNVFTHNVVDNSIQNQHILDNNITNVKIMNNVVDYKHIGIFYGLVLNQNTKDNIHVEHFADDSMPVEKFLNGSIEFSRSFYEPLPYYPYRDFTPYPIYARHIANGSITDANLIPYNPEQEQYFCVGGIDQANWKFGEKLTGDKIMPDKLSKAWFTPDVQDAMSRLGA